MDDDDDLAEEPKESSYGPVRTRDAKDEADENGIVFQPAEVEDVVVETIEEDVPYEKPEFAALTPKQQGVKRQMRRVSVPLNRMTPLKNAWMELLQPVVEHLKLQ